MANPSSQIVVVQTCVPDYRLPVFRALAKAVPGVIVAAGDEHFNKEIKTRAQGEPWFRPLRNHFLFKRSFLWQKGTGLPGVAAGTVMAEFNPRVLSTWVLLVRRRVGGRRTVLWGHVWGHERRNLFARFLRRMMVALADGVVCYTRAQADEWKKGAPGQPVWVAPNSTLSREQCYPALGEEPARNIIYVGRLSAKKNPDLLLEAVARIPREAAQGARLVLVGDGPIRAELERRAAELGISDLVEFPGHVADVERLRALYSEAAVAVSPGYVGLSVIQCLAFGVPMAVARDEPHSPEIEACVEGVTCCFFDSGSVESLKATLMKFIGPAGNAWRERREDLSAYVAERYTVELMVDGFLAALQARSSTAVPRVAFVWSQYGPYHLARLRQAEQAFGSGQVVGIEIADKTSTYAWRRKAGEARQVVTLVPKTTDERAGTLRVYRAAIAVLRQRRTEVAFIPSYWPATSLAVLLAAKRVGVRCVMMNESHAGTAQARGVFAWLKQKIVCTFDVGLVGGAPQRRYFHSLGLPEERLFKGYDAVDNLYFAQNAAVARSDAPALRLAYGLPPRYFLNIGRMEEKKNLECLVEAFAWALQRASANTEPPRLVFVGSGPEESGLREQCAALGLSFADGRTIDRLRPAMAPLGVQVMFYGFRQIEELPVFYGLAEAFVLPSIEEEWGLVVNEAMACGCAVLVSSNAGCCEDLVENEVNGWSFDPGRAEDLGARLLALAEDPQLARRMGEAGAARIKSWGCENFAENALKAAQAALSR